MGCIDHGKKGNARGYASCWFEGGYSMLHRRAYCLANSIPLSSIWGLVVRHSCDNPRCINPTHLSVGNQADNVRDSEGSHRTRVSTRVLTDTEVAALRASYTGEYGQQTALAKELGVSRLAVHQILRNKRR